MTRTKRTKDEILDEALLAIENKKNSIKQALALVYYDAYRNGMLDAKDIFQPKKEKEASKWEL